MAWYQHGQHQQCVCLTWLKVKGFHKAGYDLFFDKKSLRDQLLLLPCQNITQREKGFAKDMGIL
jgi:hypothetical protein